MAKKFNKQSKKNKDGKIQVWIKEETLAYEKELHRLQVELHGNRHQRQG